MYEVDEQVLASLLESVSKGKLSPRGALQKLKVLPFQDLGFAKVNHHRALRCGFPEVIFCQGKSTEQVVKIARAIIAQKVDLLATRASEEIYQAIKNEFPKAQYFDKARTIVVRAPGRKSQVGLVAVLCAGTSDIPVAEEARVTAQVMGCRVETAYDVGVAGIHRLLSQSDMLNRANAIVVVAGMEGALASVVGGLVDKPVIAVPTSVGYGASFSGIAPLLTMLNSCAAGVSVVNIDNGFGAGYIAALINRLAARGGRRSRARR